MAVEIYTPALRVVNADNQMLINLDALQGLWTQEQYLQMTNSSRWLLEFTDGWLEVLPMPTRKHQAIVGFLYVALLTFLQPRGGTVFFAPLRLQIREGKFREPDLLLLCDAEDPRGQNAYWLGADMVLEVVSADDAERDTVVKRRDYAEAGIPEYWIVHPEEETITVLRLAGAQYTEHGVFRRGDSATSVLLDGFAVPTSAVLDAH
jgi:Uma2 family endonuclease